MTRISRTATVHVPRSQAIDLVETFFSERPRLNVRGVGHSAAAVDVQYQLLFDWTRVSPRNDALAFAWQPRWRGFPPFGATLSLRAEGPDTQLVLEGSYEPPGGAAGRIFDQVVGKRLAARTMDALLQDITQHVEDDFAKRG
jgi:hypothetical protein